MENNNTTQYNNDNSTTNNSQQNTQFSYEHLETIPEEMSEISSIIPNDFIKDNNNQLNKFKRFGTQLRFSTNSDKIKMTNSITNIFNLYQNEFSSKIFTPKRSNSFSELENSHKNIMNKIDIDDYILIDFKENIQNNDDDNCSISSKSNENENEEISQEEYKKRVASRRKNNNADLLALRSKSLSVEKGISSFYIEENETDDEKKQFKSSNKLKYISFNLMLKEIIFNDFLVNYVLNIYHFCQQCFAFMQKDILFKKIWNCYLYYKKKDIPLDNLKNLFDFLGILVIEMYDYYKTIKKDELVLKIIKSFYYQIISDLIINLNNDKYSKIERSNIFNSEFIGKNFYHESDQKIYKLIRKFSQNKNDLERSKTSEEVKKEDRISNENDILESRNTFNSSNFNNTDNSIELQNKNTFESDDIINTFLNQNYLIEDEKDFNKIIYYEQKQLNISIEEEILCNFSSILKILDNETPLLSDLLNAKNKIHFYEDLKKHTTILKPVKKTIIKKKIEKYDKHRRSSSAMNIKKEKQKIKHRKYMQEGFFCMMDWETSEIGEILIKRTRNLFNKIERKEFYNSVFLKKDKNILSPNIQNAIKKTNDLSSFIIEDILSYDQKDDRAKTIEKWTLVAEYCKNKRDYNDCVAINSAFQNYIITGLKKTFKKIGKNIKNIMDELNDFCTVEGNYKYIREETKKIINEGNSFYPYLGLLTKDIVYDDEKSKYLIDQENINFEKIENIQNMLDNNFKYKTDFKNKIDMKIIPELSFFEKLEVSTEDERELEKRADKLEPKYLYDEKAFKRRTKIDKKYFSKFILNDSNISKKQLKSNTTLLKLNI